MLQVTLRATYDHKLAITVSFYFLGAFLVKKGLNFKVIQKPFSSIYAGPVYMFLVNQVEIDGLVFSLVQRTDILYQILF